MEENNLSTQSEVKINKKRLIIAIAAVLLIVVFLAVCAALFANREPHSSKGTEINVKEAETVPMDIGIDASAAYSHAATDNRIFFFNAGTIKIVSMTGKIENETALKMSDPIISTDGNYALISDRGNKTAQIFIGSKLDKTYTFDEDIIISNINKNGYSVFVTGDNVHKCSVLVKSPSGDEIFKWKSGSLSVLSADINDNNRDVAVTTFSTENGVMTSNIFIFNITKNKPFTNDVYKDDIISAAEYKGSYLYCIGTSKSFIYNGYGKCIKTIDYEERELITYDIDSSVFVLVFADSSVYTNGSMVCSYNSKGALQGNFSVDGTVSFINCKNGSIAVDNNRVVSILDSSCREKMSLTTATALSDFVFVGGTSAAVGISATGAELIAP